MIPEEVDSLRNYSSPGAGEGGCESQAFKSIERDAESSIKILDEAHHAIENGTIDQGQFKARHMYKEIRVLADDLQTQLRTLTASARELVSDPGFERRVKLAFIAELLLVFFADMMFTIRIMREVQRTARKRVWKFKQEK